MRDSETLILLSEDKEEWYSIYQICSICGAEFICSTPEFCPGCGRKIIGTKQGKETIYYGEKRNDD